MRAVVQRVYEARAFAKHMIMANVGLGLCVMVGFTKNDTKEDVDYIAKKILALKVFDDDLTEKHWKMNIIQKNYRLMVLRQETVFHSLNGTYPSFEDALLPEFSQKYFRLFIRVLKGLYKSNKVKSESFIRKHRRVSIITDGLFTLHLQSPKNLKRSYVIDKERYGLDFFIH